MTNAADGGPAARPVVQTSLSRLFTLTLSSSVLVVGLGFVRSKVAALVVGRAGVGTSGIAMTFATNAVIPAQLVAGPGLAAAVARATRADAGSADIATAQAAYDTAWTGTLIIAILGVGGAVLVGPHSFPALGPRAPVWLALGGLSLVATQAANVTGRTLASAGRGGAYTAASSLAATVQATGVVAGTLAAGLDGWFLGNLVGSLVPLAASGLVGGWANTAAISAIQATIQSGEGGLSSVGLFQSAYQMDAAILMAVLQTLGNFVFPRYAAAPDVAHLRSEVEEASRFVLRVAPPVLLAAIALRGPVLALAYSRDFAPAIPLLGLILAADVAKSVSWVQGGVLLYRGHAWTYAALQVASFGLLAASAVAGVRHAGLVGLGWAYVCTFTVTVALTGLAMRASAGVAPAGRTLAATFGATGLALASNAVAEAVWWGPVVPAAAAVAWAAGAGLPQAGLAALRRLRG